MVRIPSCVIAVYRPGRLRFTVTTGLHGVLSLHGELDLATAPRLEEALCARRLPDNTDVVIDLSDLAFSSCAGLTVLLAEHYRRRAANSSLLLIAPTDGVRRILSVTGLDAVFDIRPRGTAAVLTGDHRGGASSGAV